MLNGRDRLSARRILVIEDEFFVGVDLVEELEREGAETLGPVSNFSEALSLVEEGAELDAAILDINLHGEFAFPVALALEFRRVPFVFATAHDHRSLPKRYAHITHCQKPISTESVVGAVLKLLR
jgi:two-component SAPR family response regulator